MYNIYSILDWDSNFFNYKVASINTLNLTLNTLRDILKELKEKDFKLVYCFANPEDQISNSTLLDASGLLVDKKITFFMMPDEIDNLNVSYPDIIPYKLKYSTENLKSLALQSGIYSRFNIDPNFSNNEYTKLYIEWIEKSVKREIADEVLIYFENEIEKGLITLAIKDNIGTIGLLAVDMEERGKSIGKKLVQSALGYFKERKVNIVEVATQIDNKSACGFYKSLGFDVKSIVNIYHIWIS
ncbi:MAG: GNAT family N-acetyltransferase [Bacteroidales bacterium]|nr:GNAT family N-acetyltransferase [Bacteroidales bacterium]